MTTPRELDEPASRATRGRWIRALLWGLVLLPFFLQLIYLPSYGRLQSDDYYGVMDRLSDGDGLSRDLGTWWTIRVVQHRVTVPALFWGLNLHYFGGSNQPMAFLALTFLAGTFLILLYQLRESLAYPSAEFWPLAAVASILVFAPVNCVNLGISFQGTVFYLCNLFAVLSILISVRPWPLRLLWIAALGLLGLLTFSSGMAFWPVLIVGAVLMGRGKKEIAALVVFGLIALLLWTHGRMPGSGAYAVSPDPALILRYLGIFFGATFAADLTVARWVGWLGMGLAVVALAVALWRRRLGRPEVFWLMLQGYAFGSALLAALGRSKQYGEQQAISLRYGHFPALFWLGLIVFTLLLVTPLRDVGYQANWRRTATLVTQWLLVLVLSVLTFRDGFDVMQHLANRGARQAVCDLALRLDAYDEQLLRETISHQPKDFITKLPALKNLRHVPFDRDAPALDGQEVPKALLQPEPHHQLVGEFAEVVTTVHPAWTRVRGWAHHPGYRIEEIIVLDREERQRSKILVGLPDDSVAHRIGSRAAQTAGWEGFVRIQPGEGPWTAYVRFASDPSFYPLQPMQVE